MNEALLRGVLDKVALPVMLLGPDKHPVFINSALASFLGLSEADRATLSLEQIWPQLRNIDLLEGEQSVAFSRSSAGVVQLKLRLDAIGGGFYCATILSDSEVKRSFSDFHAERLQTLGMLAGGVAHDFNNILAGILGHTTYLKTILPQIGQHRESLTAIEEGARKASVIIQEILNFSRLDSTERVAKCDLGSLTKRTCALLRGAISPEFYLNCEVPDSAVIILGSESKIAQVLVNLVINARDALKSDGKISVRVVNDPRGSGEGDGSHRSARLEVQDNGHGMSKEVLARAFEPYFSTKKDKGTGLGLATVHSIVELLGGTIEVNSKVEQGTTISVFLPLIEGDPTALVDEALEQRPLKTTEGERILVVDDEFPVRNVLSLSLEHLGYSVDIAASGSEALQRFSTGSRYDLVILDMLMPNLSGEEVFFALRKLDQDVKVLIISGYSSEESVRNILEHGGKDFIQKPFTIGELSIKVRRSLGDGV